MTAVDKSGLEWIAKSGQPLRIDDVAHDPRFRACLAGIYSSGSLLAVPLMRKTSSIGGILLYRKSGFGPFQAVDQQLLSVLASMGSVAFENAELYDELKNYFTGTIRALISTVETKDPIHYGHSARVARYALMVGKQLQLSELELRRLEYLSLLHDIGKIGVPERVLRQKPELTPEEQEILKTHVLLGENIVRSIHFLPGGDKIIRWHHERFDGRGFPDGLSGESIPLFSRIIALADAFDNMVGLDTHRDIGQQTKTLESLKQGAGSLFDTALVKLFLKVYQELNG
jgi:HD-GYP domain-containing protein (c-di-GMP phosphodiesterase class II)